MSEGPISQIHSPHLQVGVLGTFSDLLSSVQILKREWGAESNGKLPNLFMPSKDATLVPAFAVKDLPRAVHSHDDDDELCMIREIICVYPLRFSRVSLFCGFRLSTVSCATS